MLANNNYEIINRMAKRTLKGNRRRYGTLITAVMLSAFLLFSILTIGTTYFKMQRMQDIRLKGADYDALLVNGFSYQQKRQCEEHPDIASVGMSAYAGYAEKTNVDDTLHVVLIWCDEVEWEEQRGPARERVKGHYPQQANELMVTKEALQDCGKEQLGIGDSFTLTYSDKKGSHTKEFMISGIWEGYGEKKVFYVSEEFFKETGYELSNDGIISLKFKNSVISQKQLQEFEENLNLEKRQYFPVTVEMEKSVATLAGIIGLILIVCLSGYLLIFNILNMSISGNVRYYGLLQTVGMTQKQIYMLLQKQMLLVGSIGTGGGILLGMVASFLLLPYIVKSLGIREENIEISFQPTIFFLCILMIGVTIYLGCRKPFKIATSVSPMVALGHRNLSTKRKSRKIRRGGFLWRMAIEELNKDKKKTAVVILSLATVLSVFLCFVTIIQSQGARTVLANYMDADLIIWNDTLLKEDEKEWKNIIDTSLLDEIKSDQTVQEVHELLCAKIIIPWEPEFADASMREHYEIWMEQPYEEDIEEYKQHPEKFYSFMNGIDETEFDYLNSSLEEMVDKEAFLNGEACIIYSNGSDLKDQKDQKDMNVKYSLYEEGNSAWKNPSYEMSIAAIVDEGYYGAKAGMAPVIIVSDSFMKKTVKDSFVFKLNIHYNKEYDEEAEAKVKQIMDESPHPNDFSYDSKIESMEGIKKAQGNMMGVGIGIVLLLFLIGILNYINTVSANIQNRKVVLAILESVGMTQKQIKQMLVREGILFAGGSLFITATVGLGVTYICYQAMNYMRIAFQIPVIPLVVVIISVVVICVVIPLVSYRVVERGGAIVERIRGFE